MAVPHRKWSYGIAASALTVALGGCAVPPARVETTPAPAAQPAAPAAPEPAETATPPSPMRDSAPDDVKVVTLPPEKLLGMKREDVVKVLGQPAFRRQDMPALLMRYRDKRCILDLFLYPPPGAAKTGQPAVAHVEARGMDGKKVPTGGCLDSVMKAHAANTPG